MTEIFLAIALICSNAFVSAQTDTSCLAASHVFPTLKSCEEANKSVQENVHRRNKSMPLGQQLHLPLLECIPIDRPDLGGQL